MVCTDHILFGHSSVSRHLGCFHLCPLCFLRVLEKSVASWEPVCVCVCVCVCVVWIHMLYLSEDIHSFFTLPPKVTFLSSALCLEPDSGTPPPQESSSDPFRWSYDLQGLSLTSFLQPVLIIP